MQGTASQEKLLTGKEDKSLEGYSGCNNISSCVGDKFKASKPFILNQKIKR